MTSDLVDRSKWIVRVDNITVDRQASVGGRIVTDVTVILNGGQIVEWMDSECGVGFEAKMCWKKN